MPVSRLDKNVSLRYTFLSSASTAAADEATRAEGDRPTSTTSGTRVDFEMFNRHVLFSKPNQHLV